MLQDDWSMVRFLPNSVSSGCTETQFDFTPQSPQPSHTSSLMMTRLSRIGERAALAAAALFGGAGLVVDQHRAAGDHRAAPSAPACRSSRWWKVTPAGHLVPGGYFFGSSLTTTTRLAPSAATCAAICGTVRPPSLRLAAGHGDRVVEQDLVGDVDAGRDRRRGSPCSRSGCRCRRRCSGTRADAWRTAPRRSSWRPRRPSG